jgi:formamidopyrimidine-DNA glycosylase
MAGLSFWHDRKSAGRGGRGAPEYAYVQLHFAGSGHLAFICPRKFARVRLIDSTEAFIEEKGLGPDARRADVQTFLQQLDGRRGSIKGRLLDQTVVAGLGNSTDPS